MAKRIFLVAILFAISFLFNTFFGVKVATANAPYIEVCVFKGDTLMEGVIPTKKGSEVNINDRRVLSYKHGKFFAKRTGRTLVTINNKKRFVVKVMPVEKTFHVSREREIENLVSIKGNDDIIFPSINIDLPVYTPEPQRVIPSSPGVISYVEEIDLENGKIKVKNMKNSYDSYLGSCEINFSKETDFSITNQERTEEDYATENNLFENGFILVEGVLEDYPFNEPKIFRKKTIPRIRQMQATKITIIK